MNFGFITTPLAYLNYRKKKEAYDAAIRKYEDLKAYGEAIVESYQKNKEQLDHILIGTDENGDINEYVQIDGIEYEYTLYVGALVGKYMSIGSELVIKNNSDSTVRFVHVETEPTLLGVEMAKSNTEMQYLGYHSGNVDIEPGEQATIQYGAYFHIQFLSKDNMKRLRQYICNAAGKKLITSVPKNTEILGTYKVSSAGYATAELVPAVTADVNMHRYYKDDQNNTVRTQYRTFDVPGKLVYMGEAWNPGLWEQVKKEVF